MEGGAATIKRLFLELGGKSAAILLDDADLNAHMAFIAGQVCMHAGQGCALTTRLLVARSRYDEAVSAAEAVLQTYPWGDPLDPANMMGPVINASQFEKVLGYIDIGRSEGRLVTGGNRSSDHERGYFIEPTLFADVDPGARVAQEEIFGPVIVMTPFDDDEEAVRIANNSIYGLSGSVTSADVERALRVARQIRTGTIGINGAVWLAPDSPFGGFKQSGIGRENGTEGFEQYLETKAIAYPA
jgi:aldehyde dehydrogenase (NAD+)